MVRARTGCPAEARLKNQMSCRKFPDAKSLWPLQPILPAGPFPFFAPSLLQSCPARWSVRPV